MISWMRFAVATDGIIVPIACFLTVAGLITLIVEFAGGRLGLVGALMLAAGLLLMPTRQWDRLGRAARNTLGTLPGILHPQKAQNEGLEGSYAFREEGYGVLITQYTGKDERVEVPVLLGGKIVTGIGAMAYSRSDRLREVTVGGHIRSIPAGAFAGCLNLRKVTVRDGVDSIGTQAFGICPQLAEVSLPASIRRIDDSAFPSDCRAVFQVKAGSEAEKYCQKQGFRFDDSGFGN